MLRRMSSALGLSLDYISFKLFIIKPCPFLWWIKIFQPTKTFFNSIIQLVQLVDSDILTRFTNFYYIKLKYYKQQIKNRLDNKSILITNRNNNLLSSTNSNATGIDYNSFQTYSISDTFHEDWFKTLP